MNRSSKSKSKEFKILAGAMYIQDNKFKANSAKGEIKFFINNDNFVSFTWKNLENNIEMEPIIIFGDEWEWKRVPTPKGRVYSLSNKSFPDDMHVFWMQYSNCNEDDYNQTIISNILKTGKLELNENPTVSKDVEMTSVEQNIPKPEEENKKIEETKVNNPVNNNSKPNNKQIDKNLINKLASQLNRKRRIFKNKLAKFPEIQKILSAFTIENFFSEEDKEKLTKLLPEGQQKMSDLDNNLFSPQFKAACDSLNHACDSENLIGLLQSFQLNSNMNTISKYANGIEAFIRGIIEKYSPNKDDNENK